MSEITDVKIGQAFPPERWALAGKLLAPVLAEMPEILHLGEKGTEMFCEDTMLALAAIAFVAERASEHCRFIIAAVPNKGKDEQGQS